MRPLRRGAVVLCAAGMLATVLTSPAVGLGNGDDDSRGNTDGGGQDGDTLTAEARTEVVITGDTGGEGDGSLAPIDTGWTPPVCWYEPFMTAEEFEAAVESLDGHANRALNIWSPAQAFTDIYRDNNPADWAENFNSVYSGVGYDNYNLDIADEGLWWHGVINPNRRNDYRAGTDCVEPIFWGDPTDVPELPEAIDDEVLAEYAYDEIGIPETEIELSPDGEQLVNLATWIWMEEALLEPRTVRAELPISGVWAETTAEPVALTIDPGSEDAVVFPASGECAVSEGGRIGAPWTRGDEGEDPPCGVRYERSTHRDGSFTLTASLTWEVSWTGSQSGGPHPLPGGVFETTYDIVVSESQAIVR
ncbi:hypothetical protein FH609_001630 [Streptomyces sp. 3MP-14]|uniref:Enoyl reductase n=1 Tax=Streptomyces mimosae TaxID=2586635 RepID=A0A5N6APZ8_9ACTN|nr:MULTISPECIES: hypothetical protein [Streptomyces]KAB8170927.1 hypothetical protein FH607_000840 [Streptomyces mimosae]KAB8179722.1 hypothetical protein FH609_001630 [Streptomyces sp. 3MP-14]